MIREEGTTASWIRNDIEDLAQWKRMTIQDAAREVLKSLESGKYDDSIKNDDDMWVAMQTARTWMR
jgi:hypothetical protein